jgi:hypothetical protein
MKLLTLARFYPRKDWRILYGFIFFESLHNIDKNYFS